MKQIPQYTATSSPEQARGGTQSRPDRQPVMRKTAWAVAALLASGALAAPAITQAKTVTIATKLKNYGGDGAYLALYLTDPQGAYAGTLWVAGGKAKYYKHLLDWKRLSAGKAGTLDGITGASVGAGRTLKVTVDLVDALLDAGYEIRVDAAVEDMRESPAEVRVPLTLANAGKPHAGRQFIQSVTYQIQ